MISVQENIDLLPFNTFKIKATAKYFTVINSLQEAKELIQSELFKKNNHLILGGGSNLLLTKDFNGLVIKNNIKGIEIVSEDENTITLKVGAGENWHEFVMNCVAHDRGGIENLAL